MGAREKVKSVLRAALPAYRVGLRVEEQLGQGGSPDWKHWPKALLTLEVQLAEHCNLNCAHCDHFSPLAEPELLELDCFTRDMARLSALFGGEMQFIKLMGGEPLLHPEVEGFLRAAREAFPAGDVLLVTNGLLLPKMPESFWLACREYRVAVTPTRYPLPAIDYAESERLAARYGVTYLYYDEYCFGDDKPRSMHKCILDLQGRQDPRESFSRCHSANACLFLQRGRMYTCPVSATARHFCRYFGQELRPSPRDSIDIYAARSGEEILAFLARPIPFCRYCDKKHVVGDLGWRTSGREIAEWTL